MLKKNSEHTLEELIRLYDEVCNWFTELGFDYTRHRYGLYKKCFDNFISYSKSIPENIDLLAFKKSFSNAYIEINEIIRIYTSLKEINPIEFLEQFKEICSGQEFRANSNDDKARDFLFELSVASRFLRAGYSVSLKEISDVVVDLGTDGLLYVECKRIKSKKQIRRNIKKANSHITSRISNDSSPEAYGLIAINITDIIPSTNHLLAAKQAGFTQIHKRIAQAFIKKNISDFVNKSNRNCFGLMIETTKMGYSSKESIQSKLFFSRQTDYIPYFENFIFEKLVPKLNNQDII